MLKQYHHVVGGMFKIVDAVVIGVAWLASYWLRFHVPIIPVTKGFPAFETYSSLLPLVMGLWILVLSGMGTYRSKRMLRRTHEAHKVLRAHGIAILIFIALTYMYSEYRYSRVVMLYFGVLGGIGLVVFRLALRNSLRALRRKGHNLRHALIVGEGDTVATLIHKLNRFPEIGVRVIGLVTQERSQITEIGGKKVLGHFADVTKLIAQTRVDQILIALPKHQYGQVDRILKDLKDETVDIKMIPDVHEYVTLGCEIEDFEGLPIVNLNDSPMMGWGAIFKRVTDFFLAAIGLLILSPLLLVLSLLVKLTSRGPIFYAQERMGLDGRSFKMWKYRSMRVDAEKDSGAVWAKQGDDRRTPLGTFLRSTSLDELPQLWNVLMGDMSLVGPRPERPVFVRQFRGEIPHYMLRHKVKAGITGWAQINGWRGNTSLDRRIEFDLYYIRNWSYSFDMKILFLTFWKGFVSKNAY